MGEIVTVQNKKGKWQAAFVQNSEVQWTDGIWYDAKEAALEGLLKLTSYELYQYLEFYQVRAWEAELERQAGQMKD